MIIFFSCFCPHSQSRNGPRHFPPVLLSWFSLFHLSHCICLLMVFLLLHLPSLVHPLHSHGDLSEVPLWSYHSSAVEVFLFLTVCLGCKVNIRESSIESCPLSWGLEGKWSLLNEGAGKAVSVWHSLVSRSILKLSGSDEQLVLSHSWLAFSEFFALQSSTTKYFSVVGSAQSSPV